MAYTNISNLKQGFNPVCSESEAHGVFYINEIGQLNFQKFDVVDVVVGIGSGTFYDPEFVDFLAEIAIKERHLIVGLMLDYNLIDPYKDLNQNYRNLLPIELYLFRSSNINFVVPMHYYRQEHSVFYIQYSK